MHPDDIDELQEKRICYLCVNEAYLSKEIQRDGDPAECSYCNETGKTYSIGEVADRVETAFEQHYYLTAPYPDDVQQMLMADRESNYDFHRYGLEVIDAIEDAGGFNLAAARDIQEILADRHSSRESDEMGEETPFSAGAHYAELGTSTRAWQEEWYQFEKSLHAEARFFNRAAAAHLAAVFGGIDKLRTVEGTSLVVDVGPGCTIDHFYRGREFQTEAKLLEALCRPDRHLGPPPADYATAGRMNAQGISVFYGADRADVAIAEVRPAVGSKVAVAKFDVVRPLRLLDLTALPDILESGSIFDQTWARLERAAFLRSLGKLMTRPVMPADEAVNYLATQAVADFLAMENDPVLDGILFPSVQAKDGRNVVLFHKAAGVERLERPAGTQTRASAGMNTSEGFEPDYTVYEATPSVPEASKHVNPWETLVNPFIVHPGDVLLDGDGLLANTLRVDLDAVSVHHVEWVHFGSTPFKVERHSYQVQNPDGLMAEPEF